MEAYRGRFLYFKIKHLGMDAVLNLDSSKPAHDHIYEMLLQKDEITWQSVLKELVKSEEMDPWDVDVSTITRRYIETVKTLKEHDLKISGKMLLAAAILLKIKSNRLVGEDIEYLDRLISQQDEEDDLLDLEDDIGPRAAEHIPKDLIPKTPQPRKRKVSIHDLMQALEKALEVKRRRVLQSEPPTHVLIPSRKKDISAIIKDVYGTVKKFFWDTPKNKLMFSELLPENADKEGKIDTFMPLLHLATAQRVDLHQEQHFGDFVVSLREGEPQTDIVVEEEVAEEEKEDSK